MRRKVKLLGKLGQLFGVEHVFDIANPAEAIRALCANFQDFEQHLYQSELAGVGYSVNVFDDSKRNNQIDEYELQLPFSPWESTLIIAPVYFGAGGGFGKILLGAALIAGSFFMPAAIPIGIGVISSTSIGLIGLSMVLGGISSLISPKNKTPKDKKESYLFDSAAETGSQGLPVPVLYGTRTITGMVVLSSSVTTVDLV